MNEFRFAEFEWLYALWGVLLISVLLVVLELRGQTLLDRMVSPLMQGSLVRRTSRLQRLMTIVLMAFALASLVVAMMRPQWGISVQRATRIDSQIMICLDVSKSMLAEDAVPNRLDRARAELDSLLGFLNDGQQVGLTAFAGKAAVVCPLTTDFGFLRLVLNEVGPGTVGLGGSRIGEAILTAVDGFRESGDVSRMILLVTDGEDHDSFPMDAARTARERGIRVISIGFGDEAGSKIEFTDPQTGERSYVRDRDGAEVISRLDGGTLREIALETEGAYIPAGTGALDLESIYRTHLVSLLAGSEAEEDRMIRQDAFQWCVLAALGFLMSSVLVSRMNMAGTRAGGISAGTAARLLFLAAVVGHCVSGAAFAQQRPVDVSDHETGGAGDASKETQQAPAEVPGLPPRETYNAALALVQTDPDGAEELLSAARRDAGIDGELRFRVLYNLGWVEVTRADAVVETDVARAVSHLQQAANRFREAIRVRPEDQDSRFNLELVSRRILELNDSLQKQDSRSIEERLDELIGRQRTHQGELRSAVGRLQPDSQQRQDRLAQQFRGLSVTERQLISDFQKLAEDARSEADALASKSDEEQTPEERLRGAQLTGLLRYLESSRSRMTKARSLIRRQQSERGFIRWSAGLSDAKRARDQLRDPVAVLGVLIPDAEELAGLTRLRSAADGTQLDLQQSAVPGWLTAEFLEQSQDSMTERVAELTAMLAAAVSQENSDQNVVSSEQQKLIEQIGKSLPYLREAESACLESAAAISRSQFLAAVSGQLLTVEKLRMAAEYFYDLRRLIEAVYGDEQLLAAALEQLETQPEASAELIGAFLPIQQKNLDRTQRIDELLDETLQQAQAAAAESLQAAEKTGGEEPSALELEQQRVDAGKAYLAAANEQMQIVLEQLQSDVDSLDTEVAKAAVAGAVEQLEELRRLYFSLVEHLRETAERQSDLNDGVGELSVGEQQPVQRQLGPLANRQRQLRQTTEQLRDGFQQQAARAANAPQSDDADPQTNADPQAQVTAEKLAQAATLVGEAETAMGQVVAEFDQLAADPDVASAAENAADEPVETAGETETADGSELSDQRAEEADDDWQEEYAQLSTHQQTALAKLLEALQLLNEAQPEDKNNDNGENQDQQQENSGQQQQQQEQEQRQEQDQQQMNASQLLQMIRDREAERRRDRQQGNLIGGGGVDRDW